MRILIATGLYLPEVGGPATWSRLIHEGFLERGHEVGVLPYREVRKFPRGISHFIYLLKLLRRTKNTGLIFLTDTISCGLPVWLACASRLSGRRYILKVGGDYVWEQAVQRWDVMDSLDEFLKKKYGWKIELMRFLQSRVAKGAKKVIVPSQYLKRVVESWRVSPEKISIIYNQVEAPKVLISKNEARRKLGVGEDEVILFSAGRDVPWKGFKLLKEIESELKKRFPKIRMVLGTFDKETYDLWLRTCDVFLQNTGYEGFSHQILEAMALGLPILTTYAGGNKEVVENRKNALVVEYNNKEAWTRAIIELLGNPRFRETISKGAKETAQKFLNRDMVGETLKVLEEAI